jgi:glucose/arabinose dehydrogenase
LTAGVKVFRKWFAGRALRTAGIGIAGLASLGLSGCALGGSAPASNVSDSGATLNGSVFSIADGNVSYWFGYGPTTAYGSETQHRTIAINDRNWHPVSEALNGLEPGVAYHNKLCAQYPGAAMSCGADESFTPTCGSSSSAGLPAGFADSDVLCGLTEPTTLRFSPDGRVFVAEKSGVIKVFDSLADSSPKVFADLSAEIHNFWDRGLLGLALDPSFPTKPYVYVLYAYDAAIGGTPPAWPNTGCPTPTTTGCMVSGRLSRLQASGDHMTGSEQVLINDWCQQFPSHSIGDLAFGADGALYASGGEGAWFGTVDYGQFGGNPCGDPPAGAGGSEAPPTTEGGALRSQSPRRAPTEPVLLSGTVIRVNPDTGAALTDNPNTASPDLNARRIVGSGLRNPFRFAVRPGTNEVWVGNVGWDTWEAIDRIDNPTALPVKNFGWPCYEGPGQQAEYQAAGLLQCQLLVGSAVTPPFYAYQHTAQVVPGESCPADENGSVISGITFQKVSGDPYPSEYDGALFFTDKQRRCIWAMERNGSALPDPSHIKTFASDATNPVDLRIGPGGDLYYVDYDRGAVHRIHYAGTQGAAPQASKPTPAQQAPTRRQDGEIFGGK